jgi:hypothetical protein
MQVLCDRVLLEISASEVASLAQHVGARTMRETPVSREILQ